MDYTALIPLLKTAPDSQLDNGLKPLLAAWANPPTALQVLELLDQCVYCGGASGTVMTLLEAMFDDRIKAEGVTYDSVAEHAVWREGD